MANKNKGALRQKCGVRRGRKKAALAKASRGGGGTARRPRVAQTVGAA